MILAAAGFGVVGVGTWWLWRPLPTAVATAPDRPERPDEIGVLALLREMLDPSLLARSESSFTAHMASSFDRRSLSPRDSDGWFANEDWASRTAPNYLGVEQHDGRDEYVLLDARGAGAVVRIWTATPTGTLRMYLDGSPTPVLSERMETLLGGQGPVKAPLAYSAARGYNLYFPFPYRSSCRITVDDLVATDPYVGGALERFYYQINYRTYDGDAAARIRSFRPSDFGSAAPLLQGVRRVLGASEEPFATAPSQQSTPFVTEGESARLELVSPGGGLIRKMVLRVPDRQGESLRRTNLSIQIDGEETVSMPVGDFVGTGDTLTPFVSLLLRVDAKGTVTCYFPMPFRNRAVVHVTGQPEVKGEVTWELTPFTDQSLYFHAARRPPSRVHTRPMRDLSLLALQGSGRFVGSAFRIENTPRQRWWGEGDERMYVDGEEFPSLFGTGTEDYYGYAWSTPERFERALHGQPLAGTRNFDGFFAMYRHHLLDAVPFSSAFRFDLELWHWDETDVSWSSTSYYYARPGVKER